MAGISKGMCLGAINTGVVYAALVTVTHLRPNLYHSDDLEPVINYGVPTGLLVGAAFGFVADRVSFARGWTLGVSALVVSLILMLGVAPTLPDPEALGWGDGGTPPDGFTAPQLLIAVAVPTVLAALALARWTRPAPPVPHAVVR